MLQLALMLAVEDLASSAMSTVYTYTVLFVCGYLRAATFRLIRSSSGVAAA